MFEDTDFERTIELGERSLGYLKAYETPATPRNYELLYAFAAGHYRELSAAIRRVVTDLGRIGAAEADRLYTRFLSPLRLGNKLEDLGADFSREMNNVAGHLHASADAIDSYAGSLDRIGEESGRVSSPNEIALLSRRLGTETRRMLNDQKMLKEHLALSIGQIEDLRHQIEYLRAETSKDLLTNIANRDYFEHVLDHAMAEADQTGAELSLLFADIDGLKAINERFGRAVGDAVLRLVARTIKANIKGGDTLARFGGDEFAIILPGTNEDQARAVAEKIRAVIERKCLVRRSTNERFGSVTISVGLTQYRRGDSHDSIVLRTDALLYAAKKAGRNRVKYRLKESEQLAREAC